MLTPAHLVEYVRLQANPGWYWPNPEETCGFVEQVERRLSRLDERQRDALMLEAQGYTQKEIAARLRVSARGISRIFRGIDAELYRDVDEALTAMKMRRPQRELLHRTTAAHEIQASRKRGCSPGGYRWRAA